jgi:hypothetical protein
VNSWVDTYNNYQKRRDLLTTLPTGVSSKFLYSTPEFFHTTDQLLKIPSNEINTILHNDYPELESMLTHTPHNFHQVASDVMSNLQWNFSRINTGNVWFVFHKMLPHVKAHYNPPSGSSDESGSKHRNQTDTSLENDTD